MKLSLQARLLLASFVILVTFVGLTGLVLETAFHNSAEAALQNRMKAYMFALLAATEVNDDGEVTFSRTLPAPRFNQAGSGLYAGVAERSGKVLLKSRSALGVRLSPPGSIRTGEGQFEQIKLSDGRLYYSYLFGVNWLLDSGQQMPLSYYVVEDLSSYQSQINQYRRSLWGWLGGAAMLLLLVQGVILRWGLKPLRLVERDLAEIEAGHARQLKGSYPRELQGLTQNLNELLENTREQLSRYRDALGNVSHSLKTPLTVLRNAIENQNTDDSFKRIASEQLDRMQQIIDYHLRRAAAAGHRQLAKRVEVKRILQKIIKTLRKSHLNAPENIELLIDEGVWFYGDEGDLFEILGNLLENAFKWGRHQIRVTAKMHGSLHKLASGLEIIIEDDGAGISEAVRTRVLERGQRADASTHGYGLGLHMVQEIVLMYGGELDIVRSDLGGAAIRVRLP